MTFSGSVTAGSSGPKPCDVGLGVVRVRRVPCFSTAPTALSHLTGIREAVFREVLCKSVAPSPSYILVTSPVRSVALEFPLTWHGFGKKIRTSFLYDLLCHWIQRLSSAMIGNLRQNGWHQGGQETGTSPSPRLPHNHTPLPPCFPPMRRLKHYPARSCFLEIPHVQSCEAFAILHFLSPETFKGNCCKAALLLGGSVQQSLFL